MRKLIIVDDEYMVLQGLTKILDWSKLGIEIVGTFSNGQEALNYILENEVDIIITDVTMPVMDGIRFLQHVAKLERDLHFIIISGYQDFEYAVEGLRLGAENYLLKPIDEVELQKNVMQVLKKIQERENLTKSRGAFIKDTLSRWVMNDIEADELRKNLSNVAHVKQGNLYTVAVIHAIDVTCLSINNFIDNYRQNLYFKDEFGNYIVVIDHQQEDHVEFVKALISKSKGQYMFGMGETTNDPMEVYLSFEHAMSALELQQFYNADDFLTVYQEFESSVSLKEYSNALGLRDIKTVKKAIEDVFVQLESQNLSPESVRQITFMMYTDLRRAFEINTNIAEDTTIAEIFKADQMDKLYSILKFSIAEIRRETAENFYNQNIKEMIRIVERSHSQDINLKTVSDALHLNTVYLGQLIKKETGKTFSQYLNIYRIRQAQKLLLTTDLNINEIAYAVGYSSSGYFYKNFKRICGVSPTEFKEQFEADYEPIVNN